MARIYDPLQLEHPTLRSFALRAAWIAAAAEAANDLEDLNIDVPPEQRLLSDFSTPWPWEFDALALAVTIIRRNRDAAQLNLEELLAAWLTEDREHWSVVRLSLIDPWQERTGIRLANTPAWLRTLGTMAATAHETIASIGSRPTA